jgi:nucleoside-diphosphate-sugar epimerase
MLMSNTALKTIAVAGASGFVGRALPDVFVDDYRLVGLTRGQSRSDHTSGNDYARSNYEWRVCDLFSRKQTIDALAGADLAVYMVHSMRSSAALTQGDFRDMDLICADNFARAARHHGVEQIVYVSGMIPDESSERDLAEIDPSQLNPSKLNPSQLNKHLASRLEVEKTLGSYGASVTTLRTGIVIGPHGDLTEMILRLVERLPVMWLPRWTQNRVSPITRSDLADLVRFVLEHPQYAGQSWDVGGPESDTVTYADILELAAELLGKKRTFFALPWATPGLSSWWISLFTGKPDAMVRPMVESLCHSVVPRDFRLQEAAGQTPVSLRDAMQAAIEQRQATPAGQRARQLTNQQAGPDDNTGSELVRIDEPNEVRSVQRLPLPASRSARWVANTYADWLPRWMRPFVHVELHDDHLLDFSLRPLPWPILELELDDQVSQPDRQLYWIRGGLLAGKQTGNQLGARLEFREVLGGEWVLAAIHDFRPRLPWPIYVITQAKIHLFVMHAFARYLGRLASEEHRSEDHRSEEHLSDQDRSDQRRLEHEDTPSLPATNDSESPG